MTMKNNKGFTLIEILAVVAILAIVFAIGVPAFVFISNNVKQSNLENKREYALARAEEWASQTGRDVTNIAHLIDEGYMEADNEMGEYKNPVNGESMLCNTIRIQVSQNQYVASFTDESYCDYQELEEQTTIIEIVQYKEDNSLITNEAWTRDNVLLKVQFKESSDYDLYKDSVTKIEWRGNSQTDVKDVTHNFDTMNSYLVHATQFMHVQYEVTVTIVRDGKTYVYKAYAFVKIDRQSPTIYQDDVSVENFDEWQSGTKTTRIVASDYDGSGVYGYYVTSADQDCSNQMNDYQRLANNTFELEFAKGEHKVCVMDYVGNVSNPVVVSVVKTDDDAPMLSDFKIDHFEQGVRYYRDLELGITITDELSGANAIRYCITTDSTCTPSQLKKVDADGYATISYDQSNILPQRVCLVGLDQARNESALKCSDAYLFDRTGPEVIRFDSTRNNVDYQLSFQAEDAESDMYQFQIFLGTSEENLHEVYKVTNSNRNGSFSLRDLIDGRYQDLKANTHYFVKLVAMNQAGITTEKTIFVDTSYNAKDAVTKCDLRDGYCNEGIYVKYGENIFVLYRSTSNSVFGVNVSNNMKTSIINDFCCDQGTCIEENVYNTSWSGIYSEDKGQDNTLKIYYDRLPEPEKYLNREDYTFGVAQGNADATGDYIYNGVYVKKKSLKAYYGLLDLGEYQLISSKPYMRDVGTLLSTVYTVCLSNDHYECNNDVDNITGIFGYNGSIRTQSAVTGAHHDISVNAAMTVPFKNTIVFLGGNGTFEDPYIVA